MVEFAWDWIDEATAECALERLPASSPSEKPSWLGRCCWEWVRGGRGGIRAPAESYFAEWADEEGFHSPWRMCDELGRRFVERFSLSGCRTSARTWVRVCRSQTTART